MSDLKKVVPITDFKVSVKHHFNNSKMVLNAPLFSEIYNYYSEKKKEGKPVKKHHTLNTLLERLNSIKVKPTKGNSIAILKGLYKGGTSGVYCYKSAPFLFFDIDVKENENSRLNESKQNADVFLQLQKIAVIVWRSNSGKGIAGVLYVPQLVEVTNTDATKHLKIGNAITDYLTKFLNVKFDNAQNKFRQVRYLALQTEKRFINTNPYVFTYELKEIVKVSNTGVKQYRFTDNRAVFGSIKEQFNQSTTIETALLNTGFSQVNSNRYKHPSTTSKDTGFVKNETFVNFSSSFSTYYKFTPFDLYLKLHYNNDYKQFLDALKKKGYKEKQPQQKDFKKAENLLKQPQHEREKQIFTACYDLIKANYKDKVNFINKNAKNDAEKILFFDYLKIKPLSIQYDKTLKIKNYVSEQLNTILNYSDVNNKTILTAETGTGKTTSFLMDFTKYRPKKRLLILAPLTAIVEQTKAEFSNIVTLTANSTPEDHIKAKRVSIVMATYEQGYKHLKDPNTFDYVVIDEVHNLIVTNSYKRDAIKNLTSLLSNYKTIGLTGTTNQLFKAIGYKLVNVKKQDLNPVDVYLRVDNRQPLKIALQHLQTVKGKCILRVNSRNVAIALQIELIKLKRYKKSEILILNSDNHIKKSQDFKQLTKQSKFNDVIKLVITTALIDEGLSIKQKGFTDVVFIETDYKPMPESVKQFFARFRNEDKNRKNYFYYKETKDQTLKSWNPHYNFIETKKNLIAESENINVNDTDKKDSINTKYLYYDNSFVNDYALAYDVSKTFFGMMTKQEFIHFLELNYNINIIEDKKHIQTKFDTNESKKQNNQNKQLVANNWLNNKDEVLNALFVITDNSEIKKSISYIGLQPKDEIYNLVSDNLKTFEDLQRNSTLLERFNIKNVDSILIDTIKLKPIDLRNVNRKIKLFQNIDTINNPKTKTDEKNKTKLLNFLKESVKLKNINKRTLFKEWNKLRCNSKKPSYYNLIDLLEWYKTSL
ncbi:DEAD/DEAH box helicase [Polaribacter sargassicola]|uniref:DEAD/DEAH box helicase n=1 Tax=Polaribacter sargassicola TaxID=2836891 RepID=UPI001F1B9E82|nr:DEAD/DEAH box helicase family protein [Polaribacter sp. DS7-9]MCG1035217.1 DEAD/DEAH box helicase family protein [Polaribacter sp. DS7-9]